MAKIDRVRRDLKKAYRRQKRTGKGGWREVGDLFGVSEGMAYRIAEQGYEPKDPHIRLRLGLSAMGEAPVCERCGVVHVSRRCPQLRKARRWRDVPVEALRMALEGRREVDAPPEIRDLLSAPRVKRPRYGGE